MECYRCKRPAGVKLVGGRFLCEPCFLEFFEKRVSKTIRVNSLLEGDDRTAVALSGGKDSAVVLSVLYKLHLKAPRAELLAISIDQGVPGAEGSLSASKRLCEALGVEHHVYSFKDEFGFDMEEIAGKLKELKNPSMPCTYCGVLRRKILNDKAKELGVSKIATGHNLDDEVQTAMMNFIRGEIDRIARMGAFVGVLRDAGFVPRIKPLRDSPESEVLEYARLKGLAFESSPCPYSSEAFRKSMRAAIDLIESNHPGSKFQILRSTDKLIPLIKQGLSSMEINRCSVCGDPTSGYLCRVCQIRKDLELK